METAKTQVAVGVSVCRAHHKRKGLVISTSIETPNIEGGSCVNHFSLNTGHIDKNMQVSLIYPRIIYACGVERYEASQGAEEGGYDIGDEDVTLQEQDDEWEFSSSSFFPKLRRGRNKTVTMTMM